MVKKSLILLIVSLIALPAWAYRTVKLSVERMPDLHTPRGGCNIFYVEGEVVVVGGHTNGFIPTSTAEYFRDGAWHLMKTVYEHDDGFFVQLKSGDVLIAGGHEKALGIGQTFPAEIYHPSTHSFEGFGCLDMKRSLAHASLLGNGSVVIAGNWYAGDSIELFDGKKQFSFVKKVSQSRSCPHIFPTGPDDAMIFSSSDIHGNRFDSIVIDRLKGDPFYDGKSIQLGPNSILVVEGIHALNPKLTAQIADELKFKVYVSTLTQIAIDDVNSIRSSENRMLRRIVRDNNFRGWDAYNTLHRWHEVRRGEEINIFPYQEQADVMFNSALLYELGVLKLYAAPQLKKIPENCPEYAEAQRLLDFIDIIEPIEPTYIPPTSIMREFLGGSSFNY